MIHICRMVYGPIWRVIRLWWEKSIFKWTRTILSNNNIYSINFQIYTFRNINKNQFPHWVENILKMLWIHLLCFAYCYPIRCQLRIINFRDDYLSAYPAEDNNDFDGFIWILALLVAKSDYLECDDSCIVLNTR